MDELLANNGTYAHNANFAGIFVTFPIIPIRSATNPGAFMAYAPHTFFTNWEMQPEMNRFIGPLKYILSAN
jgi:hypothetical protein